jgi:putative PIG3 family NAD(P)H quinone oxidoreductase
MTEPFPQTMTRIEIDRPGPPEVLTPRQAPTPRPAADEVLIAVEAAGINRPDVLQRLGKYPPPPGASEIPGLEVAGRVVAVGSEVTGPEVGARVCALVSGGGYAEYCVAPAVQCLPVPTGFSMVEAAALPETCFTVWCNVFERGALKAGETLLVHGGSGGIGTTAIQMAAQFGARVMATAGSEHKCNQCRQLGAERAVNYRSEDFQQAAKDWTDGRGVDVILDIIGGDYVDRNLRTLAVGGRLVQVAFLQGSRVSAEFGRLLTRRLTWTGSTLRPQSTAAKGAIAGALRQHVWPLLEAGRMRPPVFRTFPLNEAAEAHRLMESGEHIGKIVLRCGE